MKDPDFLNPEDHKHIEDAMVSLTKHLLKTKEQALVEAIEVVDGKVPSFDDMRKFGHIMHYPKESREVVFWRGKPILEIIINVGAKNEIKIKKLYEQSK